MTNCSTFWGKKWISENLAYTTENNRTKRKETKRNGMKEKKRVKILANKKNGSIDRSHAHVCIDVWPIHINITHTHTHN